MMNWLGGVAGDILALVVSGSAAAIAGVVVNWLLKLAAKLKIDIKDADRKRLQELVENGIKWAARELNVILDGNVSSANKTRLVEAVATEYLPKEAKETVAALGGDVDNEAEMTKIVTARSADILALPAEVVALANKTSGLSATGMPATDIVHQHKR